MKNPKPPNAAITPQELWKSGILPLGRSQIYSSLQNGTIPSIKVGKKFLIPRAAIDRWLESCGGNAA